MNLFVKYLCRKCMTIELCTTKLLSLTESVCVNCVICFL